MPKRLSDLFDGQNIRDMDPGVVYKVVSDNIKELDSKDFTKVLDELPWQAQVKLMKQRCVEANDKMACLAYDLAVNGDPSAPVGTTKNLGLKGLAINENNRFAKELLQELGEL